MYKIVFLIAKFKLMLSNAVLAKIPNSYQLINLLVAYLHNVLCVIQLQEPAVLALADIMSIMDNVLSIH